MVRAGVVSKLRLLRNRMREILTSGSVGGLAGKPPVLPGKKDGWVIPPEQDAEFVAQMEKVMFSWPMNPWLESG